MVLSLQDSYALCRVFKKNVVCAVVEDHGQCSSILLIESPQAITNDQYETMSPDLPVGSSSCVNDDDDKDDAWMQFITEDVWCSNNEGGADDPPHPSPCVAFAN